MRENRAAVFRERPRPRVRRLCEECPVSLFSSVNRKKKKKKKRLVCTFDWCCCVSSKKEEKVRGEAQHKAKKGNKKRTKKDIIISCLKIKKSLAQPVLAGRDKRRAYKMTTQAKHHTHIYQKKRNIYKVDRPDPFNRRCPFSLLFLAQEAQSPHKPGRAQRSAAQHVSSAFARPSPWYYIRNVYVAAA